MICSDQFPDVRPELIALVEASRFTSRRRKLAPLRAAMAAGIRSAFDQQSRLFRAGLSTLQSVTGWLPVWRQVEQQTVNAFTLPLNSTAPDSFTAGAVRTLVELGQAPTFANQNAIAAYVQQAGAQMVTQVNSTTRQDLNRILQQSVSDGWSRAETRNQIAAQFTSFKKSRVDLIVHNELGNAFAEGNLAGAWQLQSTGVTVLKSWLTTGDGKVTVPCVNNGAVGYIALAASFPSGHLRPLRFPRCRCDNTFKVA